MQGFSALSLLKDAVFGSSAGKPLWRTPDPKPSYDAIIIGGGGHGLATAYYLAKVHGIRNIAVVERGWIGGGNTGRNTTVVRSNYLYPESVALYDFALRLYEGLAHELNFNIMLSQRGMIMIAHSQHELDACRYWANAMHLNGVDSEMLSIAQIREMVPFINMSPDARHPVWGGYIQKRAGIARHDAVAWGYARAADALGVDIIQNCEVTGFVWDAGRISGVETTRGRILAGRVGLTVAGSSSALASLAGFRLPIVSYALQAMVSEPVKPFFNTVVLSLATGVYLSQSDKGELVIGGELDRYPSYAQRGSFPTVERVISGAVDLFPCLGNMRLMRTWGGLVDVVHDSSPIIGASPVPGLLLNCGWGTGGFKAIPAGGWLLAWHMAKNEPHPIAAPFGLERFSTGALIDEAAASGIAH